MPHFLALSSNSAFWEGVDTGHASARARMFRPSAISGIPPYLSNWADYCSYCDLMIQAGTLSTAKEIYWDIRPRADLGTVEFRIFDAPKSFEHLLFLTTLVRLFTLQTLEDLEGDPKLGRGNPAVNWLAEQNRFLASRYGLSARCSRLPGLKPRTLAEDLAGLLTRLSSRTAEQSEVKHLRLSEPLDRFDSGAARQRQLFRKTGRWESVVEEARRNWFAETGDLSPHPIPSRLPAFMDTPPPVAGVSLS